MNKSKSLLIALTLVLILSGCSKDLPTSPMGDTSVPTEEVIPSEAPEPEETHQIETPEDTPDTLWAQATTEPGYFGKLHVEGPRLMGEDGNPAQLRGISSHGLNWFPEFINRSSMIQMRQEWGCNVVRLAMYTDDYEGYCVSSEENKEELKDFIYKTVGYAEALDMYVIIDWHILSDNSPLIYKDEAIGFFSEMAQEYADHDNVIFEICNEPNGNTTWEEVREYALEVIPVIRKNSDAVILVGTPTWSQDIHLAAQNPITDYDNIMYTLHFYAASHGDVLRNRLMNCVTEGFPVFVSEYGICDASGNGEIDEAEADKWLDTMDALGVSHVMWNLSNKDESSAMIVSESEKTSYFEFEDMSPTGRWFQSRVSGGVASRPGLDEVSDNAIGMDSLDMDALTVTLKNSWDSGDNSCYEYSLILRNTAGGTSNSWTVTIGFNQTVAVSDGWNGRYSPQGDTLSITPQDHNAQVNASNTGDIGFILEAGKNLKIISAEVDFK